MQRGAEFSAKNIPAREDVNNFKVKRTVIQYYRVPIRVQTVSVGTTNTYIRDGQKKSATTMGFADQNGAIKGQCFDSSKLTTIKENCCVMIRNYIFRNNTIIITSATEVNVTSGVGDIALIHRSQSAELSRPPPPPAVVSIEKAKKTTAYTRVSERHVDAVLERVTLRTKKTIKLKQLYLQDSTREVKISMWRQLAESSIEVGKTVKITFLKLNIHKGQTSLQTSPQSTLEFVSEQHKVVIDGFCKEEDDIILVCKQDEVYTNYKCPRHALNELVGDEEEAEAVIDGMIPFNARIVVSGNNTISSVTMD
ncbi:uncharacterized protein LOC127722415 [Mytilus californianus]|uniref:uncharacterized protein LOC127722415 n=1 Tax=Mytilus californianus TaxID=6549 RepID=UPI002247866D|nr:uncharacterized protein LOC127722415 [Mytilus californianus]